MPPPPCGAFTFPSPNDFEQSRAHNQGNEITSISGLSSPLHDPAGNMVFGPRPADANAAAAYYRYDAWNRLAKVYLDPNNGPIATYRYDGLNRRVKTVTAVDGNSVIEYIFHNEGWQVVEIRRGVNAEPGSAAYKQYAWDIRYIDAPVCRWWDDDANSETAVKQHYFTNDGNFNTTALVDGSSGSVVERYLYDPYGRPTFLAANWTPISASAFDNEILYCGYHYDAATGLHQVRNRYYNWLTGRWMTTDPSGYVDGMSLYEYCGSTPIVRYDPSGLASLDITLVQGWIELSPGVDAKTKFMLKQLKQKNVTMYVKDSWVWHFNGEKDYIWIDCDYNGLTEATAWYEDGMREWAHNNREEYRNILRAYAIDVRDSGGTTVKVLADTYDFAHKWTKWESGDPSSDMMWVGIGSNLMWAFADSSMSSGTTAAAVNTTNHGRMSRYFYDMTARRVNSEDQTHHFAAYFYTGEALNPTAVRLGLWKTKDTPRGNPGDYLLGVVAGELGYSYAYRPRYLGKEIKDSLEKDPARRSADEGWNDAIDNAAELLGIPGSLPSRGGVIGPWVFDTP